MRSAVSPLVAVRASSRPKKISTSGRATCVESTRSDGSWKLPTLSERECRSATDAALGANGSWTWTMSKSTPPRRASRPLETSSGSGTPAGTRTARHRQPGPDGQHRRAVAARALTAPRAVEQRVGRSRAALIRRRASRVASPTLDGAATTTSVAALGELARRLLDELVDLVALAPGCGRHLGDAKAVARIGPRSGAYADARASGLERRGARPEGRAPGSATR